MTLSVKLAGALGGLAHGWDVAEAGLTIASLKRALAVLHQALSAAGAARIAYFCGELFALREEMPRPYGAVASALESLISRI